MPREIKSASDIQAAEAAVPSENNFKDRLVKLIPSEIVTAYVTIQGLISSVGNDNTSKNIHTLMWIIISVLFALTPVYLWQVGNVRKKGQIVFTTIAFFIWVMAIGSPIGDILGFTSTFIGSIILVLYTLMIPFFYKG